MSRATMATDDPAPVRTITETEIKAMLAACIETRYPHRNKAVVLLAARGGLAPREIAALKRRDVLNDDGLVGGWISVDGRAGRYLKPRRVPIAHKGQLWWALHDLLKNVPAWPRDPLILSERALDGGGAARDPGAHDPLNPMRPASICYLMWKLLRKAGITDASAIDARTTFIVQAARQIQRAGGSLRDIQDLAGHGSLESTQRLIERSEAAQRRVVDLLERARMQP